MQPSSHSTREKQFYQEEKLPDFSETQSIPFLAAVPHVDPLSFCLDTAGCIQWVFEFTLHCATCLHWQLTAPLHRGQNVTQWPLKSQVSLYITLLAL